MNKQGLFSIINWNKCTPVDLDNDTESEKILRLILQESNNNCFKSAKFSRCSV